MCVLVLSSLALGRLKCSDNDNNHPPFPFRHPGQSAKCCQVLSAWLTIRVFWTFAGSLLAPPSTPSLDLPGKSSPSLPDWPDPGFAPSVDILVCTPPHVSLVNAVVFTCTCKLEGSVKYQLQLCPSGEVKGWLSSTSPAPDLSSVPPEYHNYADVFTAKPLNSHCIATMT